MYRNKLKTIAVFTSELQSGYQKSICHYISVYAKKMNYNVAIFNWNNPYGQQASYLKGEVEILDLPDYRQFDGIIYLKDTFGDAAIEKVLEEHLKNEFKGPCVAIRTEAEGCYNVIIDGAAGISSMVRHFITEHRCRKIAYMSGTKDRPDAQSRLDAYKSVMDEYGLTYDESYIFHGNFWKDKAAEAADYFINSPLGLPEAIVCANDFMAVSLMQELIGRGYMIPEEIRISGFDNINEGIESVPSLSTIDMPIEDMAAEGVKIIDNVLNNREQKLVTVVGAVPIYRDTCGCGDRDVWEAIRDRMRASEEYNNSIFTQRQLRFFTVELETTSTLSEVCDVVDNFAYIMGSYSNFFMCLTKDPHNNDLENVISSSHGYTSESLCALAIVNRMHTEDYPLVFDTSDMIPDIYTDDTPQIYYFSPLHFLDQNYGYIAVSYSDYMGLARDFYSFTTHISNALDSLRNKHQLEYALKELERLYISDPLTGLYNRRGFEKNALEVFNDCMKNRKPVMVMEIDMDGLKHINDNYGHQQGDIAIQLLGKALAYSAVGKEICARVGGDEFNIIAGDYSLEEIEVFISSIKDFLDSYNDVSDAKYNVTASFGYVLVDDFDSKEKGLEHYLNLSDDLMYKQKLNKKHRETDTPRL